MRGLLTKLSILKKAYCPMKILQIKARPKDMGSISNSMWLTERIPTVTKSYRDSDSGAKVPAKREDRDILKKYWLNFLYLNKY